ncbi:uncharacterized protein LOC101851529 [Aplysia californica]|uniref:Uncharacterized protein LOC101851529 n=1 Tax=Aplysia californica TaxID=6500 RepID=A0ABM1A8X4_APLCA|nr:uncharacterized protein LOC101851529 [Aplysia californica]
MKALTIWILAVVTTLSTGQLDREFIGMCDQPWTPTFAHDYRGVAVLGSRSILQERILKGYMVRVQFSTKEWAINFMLDDFTFRGRHVCGGASWILSDNGTHIDTDADWLPTLVCTNGEVNRLNYTTASWNREIGKQDLELDGEIWWFSKPTSCDEQPVYSQFVDGSVAYGSLNKLLKLSKWSELRVSMRDRGYSFLVQNTKTYDNELLTAQSLNHISLRYTSSAVKYNEAPYYNWLAVWATNGRRDVSRWYLSNTTLYKHNNDFVSLDWYGDQCWRRVYSTDYDGFPTYGSLEELIQLVKLGHRLRMHFDGYTLKANGIRVLDGQIVAQTIEEYARRGSYPSYEAPFFNSKARAVYRLVHSTGMVKTYMYNIDDFQLSEKTQKKFAIDWMVDTRKWVKVFRTDANGQVTFGMKRDLEEAVGLGASVRLDIEQDELAGQFFTEADNVRLNFFTTEIYAQALKHVSDQKQQSVDEYILQSDIFRWSLMVSTNGVVAMNARRLTSKTHLYDAVSPATNVTWFVNI